MSDDKTPAVFSADMPALMRDGWISLPSADKEAGVHARVEERGDRQVVTDLYLHAGEITSAVLRTIPIGRIEAYANLRTTEGWMLTATARPVSMAKLRERLAEFLGRKEPAAGERLRLARPDGTDPDAFSRQVAAAYSAAVVTTSKPAKMLAEEAGVPVGTVHRWIRDARQRGHLPPARKGRAG